ncbi:MAG: hypothetical protein AB7G15_20360 [Alphaproteobacteria bacterium]
MQSRLKSKLLAVVIAVGASASVSWLAGPSSAQIAENRVLIPAVQKAELVASNMQPQSYQIIVTGTVPGPGWGDGDLIPTRKGAPANGIWEFRFVARRGATTGAQPEPLVAGYRVPGSQTVAPRGVRVQTARGVFTQMFDRPATDAAPPPPPSPTAVPVAPPPAAVPPAAVPPATTGTQREPPRMASGCLRPLQSWVGQRLVRVLDDQKLDGVKELELCRPYVVISPERPFTDRMHNPSRLRLQIDEQNIIRAVSMG